MCRYLQLLRTISQPIRRQLAALIRIFRLLRCAVSLSPFPHLIVVIAPDAFLYPAEKGLKRCCSSHTTFCVRVFAVRYTLHVLWELSKLNGCQEEKNTEIWITSSKVLRKLRLRLKSLFDERVVFEIPNRKERRSNTEMPNSSRFTSECFRIVFIFVLPSLRRNVCEFQYQSALGHCIQSCSASCTEL